jgi:hypothetical protein
MKTSSFLPLFPHFFETRPFPKYFENPCICAYRNPILGTLLSGTLPGRRPKNPKKSKFSKAQKPTQKTKVQKLVTPHFDGNTTILSNHAKRKVGRSKFRAQTDASERRKAKKQAKNDQKRPKKASKTPSNFQKAAPPQ